MVYARLAIPLAGLHVDIADHWVGIWTTTYLADLLTEMPRLWPGWRIVFWEDRYEEHAAETADAIELAICDERAAMLGESAPGGHRILRDLTFTIPTPIGDRDPDMVRRAEDAYAVAAARVIRQLAKT